MIRKLLFIFTMFICSTSALSAQGYILDQIVAVVGGEMIKQSELEDLYLQARAENSSATGDELRCIIFQNTLTQKLFLAQAKVDSIEVESSQVEMQMNQRLQYYIETIGSQEKLEAYFKKNIQTIREDLRKALTEETTANQVRDNIVKGVQVTPTEVRQWFKKIPKDSIPLIPAKIQIAEIAIYPPFAEKTVSAVKDRLLALRKRILDGDRFASLAVMYSEDLQSATRGGEIGFANKGTLDPAYAKAAWSLKPNEVSRIVEDPSGYHLIQMIEKRGDLVNTRHILLKPKPDAEETGKAMARLDSIAGYIRNDSISFSTATRLFSEEKNTRFNEGLMINQIESSPDYGGTWFEMKDLSEAELKIVRNLKPGEISAPYETVDDKGKTIYKIIKIVNQSEPHHADPDLDYAYLEATCKREKDDTAVREWILEKIKAHYIRIDESYRQCSFLENVWLK